MINNRFITRADLPNIAGMLGNANQSWNNPLPNDLYIRQVPKCIFSDQSATKLANGGNVGAGLDLIHRITLPAGTLKANGDFIELWYSGDYAANNNDKRVVAQFASNTYEDSGLRDLDGATGWSIRNRISRVSSTAILVGTAMGANSLAVDSTAAIISTFNEGFFATTRSTPITGLASLDTNSIDLDVLAEATNDDDVTITQAIVFLTRF